MNKVVRILLVDDEPNLRLMLRTVLESAGYSVVEAEDGEAALARLRESPIDLILLDLEMPKTDGMATLRSLRDAGDETPVVIITAHGSIPDAVVAMRLGAIDFLSKPLTPEALRRTVVEVLARQVPTPQETTVTKPTPRPAASQVTETLARAKRALNRREFAEAETVLRQALALDPNLAEAHDLLGILHECRAERDQGPFRALRGWFPVGRPPRS